MKYEEIIMNQKVFRFINSYVKNDISYFFEFLRKETYPVEERWVFYFCGKYKGITEYEIDKMSSDNYNNFNELLYGQVYFWKLFREDFPFEKFVEDINLFEEQNLSKEQMFETYYKKGWEYVDEKIEYSIYMQNYEENKSSENYSHDYVIKGEDCSACGENPCMCSDIEKTSTISDF